MKSLHKGIFACSFAGLAACAGSATGGPPPVAGGAAGVLSRVQHGSSSGTIQHVIIVVQENRSFNNLFMGYPGATTQSYGYNHHNKKVVLQPVSLATTWDLQHNAQGFIKSCNGTGSIPGTNCQMNGFDKQTWTCGGAGQAPCPDPYPPYSYVPQYEIQPYLSMANQYVLADQMFASDFDTSSFMSHQYLIAGVNPNSSVNYPTSAWGCPGGPPDQITTMGPNRRFPTGTEVPCWDPPTLADELDAAGLSWSYYASAIHGKGSFNCGSGASPDASKNRTGIWSAYQAINHICYGKDWDNVISPSSQFLTDVGNGKLGAVNWVTPTYANSDHGGSGSKTGPSWVASVVNAVGESPFWNTSAIFILWDDSGGWYDPVAPAYVDNDGLGFRLPLLVISPYAKQNYVSHVPYEHGSILKFVEDTFGLGRLANSDARANTPATDCFDFNQSPRPFSPIGSPYDRSYFLRQKADDRVPDAQ